MPQHPSSKFGLYKWLPEDGDEHICKDDLQAFAALVPHGKIFHSIGRDNEWMVLAYGDKVFRVNPGLFHEVAGSPMPVGSSVQLLDGTPAIVGDVLWHFARNEPMYFLVVQAKRESRRYWAVDFLRDPVEETRSG
jgi:hypothetical protein